MQAENKLVPKNKDKSTDPTDAKGKKKRDPKKKEKKPKKKPKHPVIGTRPLRGGLPGIIGKKMVSMGARMEWFKVEAAETAEKGKDGEKGAHC